MTPTSENSSPTNDPPEFVSRPPDLSDDDDDDEEYPAREHAHIPRKEGGYDSRIEQILYENPDLQIMITDAGKALESGGSYIVYTIRTGVSSFQAGVNAFYIEKLRISKFVDDIQNSALCGLLLSTCILL